MKGRICMPTESDVRTVTELLLTYLQSGKVLLWPGADGLLVEDVLSCYPEAMTAHEVPDCHELRRRNPELSRAIQAFWAGQGWLENRIS
jgi:hypothetical protein